MFKLEKFTKFPAGQMVKYKLNNNNNNNNKTYHWGAEGTCLV